MFEVMQSDLLVLSYEESHFRCYMALLEGLQDAL